MEILTLTQRLRNKTARIGVWGEIFFFLGRKADGICYPEVQGSGRPAFPGLMGTPDLYAVIMLRSEA